jgi:flagellar basal body-associated protein FliL
MANDHIQEITPGGGGGGGNPLIPAIAVLVLMPVISFALTKFLFIPQIQSAVTEVVAKASGGEGGAAAGAHGKAADAHGAAPADAHGAPADAHGKPADAHGATPATPAAEPTYKFENIIANLSGSSINRYVKVSFIVEGEDPAFSTVIEANRVKMIDATISVLSSLTSLDLQNPGVKNQVRGKLIAAFDTVLKKRMVSGLYFSEFVVQ